MPRYHYYCEKCRINWHDFRRIDDRYNVKCKCGAKPEILIGLTNPHFFPEGLWREMNYKGVHIKSKKHLKEECYKRGAISPYFDIYPRSSGYEQEQEYYKAKDRSEKEAR